jgi:ABC-2 type transport system ATP-binding protein
MIAVRDVRKSYGAREALRGVSLELRAGEIVALLGPNGAGKTTLMSVAAGLLKPDAGEVEILGRPAAAGGARRRRELGLAPQDLGIYPLLSVRDNLSFFAGLAGIRGRERRETVSTTAESLGLETLLDRTAGRLSGGEQRRLHTAMALVHRPRVLLLDEPTVGADVATRRAVLDLIREQAQRGTAICYSTHYLPEAEAIATKVVIIDNGRFLVAGTIDELVARFGTSGIRIAFDGPESGLPAEAAAVGPGTAFVPAHDPEAALASTVTRLVGSSVRVRGFELVSPNLECVYQEVIDGANRNGTNAQLG